MQLWEASVGLSNFPVNVQEGILILHSVTSGGCKGTAERLGALSERQSMLIRVRHFHFSILTLSNAFLSIHDKEMKSESGFCLANG